MSPLYFQNIRTGLLIFLIAGFALLIPVVAFHYVRFGRVEPRRSFVLYAALLYGVVLVALVFLPFPPVDSVCRGQQSTQWVPFQWVTDTRRNLAYRGQSGAFATLKSKALLSFAFNVALFVPLGVLARRAYRRSVPWTLAAGLGASLLLEITQLTGNFFVYPCPYRIFDVDDLIANTTGTALGILVAPLVGLLPAVLPARESQALPDAAGLPRQILAFVLDMLLCGLALTLWAGLSELGYGLWQALVVLVVVRVLLPRLTGGHTPGGFVLGFRVRRADGSTAGIGRLIVRDLLGPLTLLALVALLIPFARPVTLFLDRLGLHDMFGVSQEQFLLMTAVIGVGVVTLVALAPVFRTDQRAWHDLAAGTRCVLDRTDPSEGPAGPTEPELSPARRADA